MNKIIFAIAITTLAIYGCKKSEPAGSQYTSQMAGTRQYRYEHDERIGSWDSTIVDTVSAEIKYVNPSTIKFNSTTLSYSPGQSNDSLLIFTDPSATQPNSDILTYNRLNNKISYVISSYVSAGGQFYTGYTSL